MALTTGRAGFPGAAEGATGEQPSLDVAGVSRRVSYTGASRSRRRRSAPKDVRIVQFTPPGSGCSVTFGTGLTPAAPGSAFGTLVVSDIVAAHDDLVRRGIDASDMWHGAPVPPEARIPGPDPKRTSYGSFFAFSDPDGNAWIVQEVTTRRPGRA